MELFHYDPITGVRDLWDYDPDTGVATIRREQNVQPVLDYAAAIRSAGASDRKYQKGGKEAALYAVIPAGVQFELLKKGIDIHDPNCTKRLLETINRDYPYLKMTDKVHVANH